MSKAERLAIAVLFILALLLLIAASARADGIPLQPAPPPYYHAAPGVPFHIYRDGNYFFCPDENFDPYCRMPSDYSWALHGRPLDAEPRQDFGQEAERARIIRQGTLYCQKWPSDPICPR